MVYNSRSLLLLKHIDVLMMVLEEGGRYYVVGYVVDTERVNRDDTLIHRELQGVLRYKAPVLENDAGIEMNPLGVTREVMKFLSHQMLKNI